MKIFYYIEDDPFQADYLQQLVKGIQGVEMRVVGTESEFLSRWEEIAEARPALVILDALIQWSEEAIEPKDGKTYFNAGLRCYEKIKSDPRMKLVPVLFLTVLDKDAPHLPPNPNYLRKDASDNKVIKTLISLAG